MTRKKISGASVKITNKAISNKNGKSRRWLVRVSNEQDLWEINRTKIKNIARAILKEMGNSPLPSHVCELSLLFTDNSRMRVLNRNFRKKDKATDVLSFSQLEGEESGLSPVLGDIVISIEYAASEATKRKLSVNQEILRLLIHGILHLFGYDHEHVSNTKRQQMKSKEDKLFKLVCASTTLS